MNSCFKRAVEHDLIQKLTTFLRNCQIIGYTVCDLLSVISCKSLSEVDLTISERRGTVDASALSYFWAHWWYGALTPFTHVIRMSITTANVIQPHFRPMRSYSLMFSQERIEVLSELLHLHDAHTIVMSDNQLIYLRRYQHQRVV